MNAAVANGGNVWAKVASFAGRWEGSGTEESAGSNVMVQAA